MTNKAMKRNIRNKIKLIAVLFALLTLFGSYVSLDWSRVMFFPIDTYIEPYAIVRAFKLLSSFLCAFLVWTTFSNKFSESDSRKIKAAFVVIFIGDASFTFGFPLAGVISFALGQILLTIRNADGLKNYIVNKFYLRDWLFNSIIGTIIVLINVSALYFVFFRTLGFSPMFILFAVYSIFLCLSVWFAWVCIKIDYFADINSILIALGMSFFFLCDFTVGFNMSSPDPQTRVIVSSLTWMFYAPALIMLSLSSYNFDSFLSRKSIMNIEKEF